MTPRASASARALAAAALIGGFLVLIVVISGSLGDGGDAHSGKKSRATQAAQKKSRRPRSVPASYVVQNGDTLTSIAHKTGVSVARIQALNPGVDPQILISGEKLRLR
jgi:LysM repeat protein